MRTDEEVALWKAIMVEYYGEEDSEEDDDEEDEESSAADVDELLKQLHQLFRPDQEDMGVLLARVRVTRLVMALKPTIGLELGMCEP